MASTIGPMRWKNASPTSVGATRRVVLCSRRTASRSSSRFSRFETTATDRPSSDPACVRLPVRTTRAKISRSLWSCILNAAEKIKSLLPSFSPAPSGLPGVTSKNFHAPFDFF
jgi:hypothetical protein